MNLLQMLEFFFWKKVLNRKYIVCVSSYTLEKYFVNVKKRRMDKCDREKGTETAIENTFNAVVIQRKMSNW